MFMTFLATVALAGLGSLIIPDPSPEQMAEWQAAEEQTLMPAFGFFLFDESIYVKVKEDKDGGSIVVQFNKGTGSIVAFGADGQVSAHRDFGANTNALFLKGHHEALLSFPHPGTSTLKIQITWNGESAWRTVDISRLRPGKNRRT